ncbi:hypothetical protein [Inquilinus sp. CA228]|uniref:hypothetical protein n=1 Tax=Inquilinus sp. CA228 TaxID=3455609 RepID=UPI003F8D09DD
MRSIISSAFTVIDLDSAALAGTATIAHPLPDAEALWLAVHQEEHQPLWTAIISVRDASGPMHITLDLGTADSKCSGGTESSQAEYVVRRGGYLCLRSSAQDAGRFALLRTDGKQPSSWDSRSLAPGDVFAFLAMRPGTYALANRVDGAGCTVTVTYPDPRHNKASPRQPAEPIRIPSSRLPGHQAIAMDPGQGLVVDVEAAARLTFNLQTADDGPPDLAEWRRARSGQDRQGRRTSRGA